MIHELTKAHNSLNKVTKILVVGLCAICAIFLAGSGFAAQPVVPAFTSSKTAGHVEIPKLGAFFIPARGLEISENFDGFASEERGMEVVVAVIKSPYSTIEESFNENTLKSRGVKLFSKAAFTLNGSDATMMKALHPSDGVNWGKWILLLDGRDRTLVVTGIFLSGDEEASVDIEKMLKSAFFEPSKPGESAEPGNQLENPVPQEPSSNDAAENKE